MLDQLKEQMHQDWSGKTVLIGGFGVDAGESAVDFFLEQGARVRVFDARKEDQFSKEILEKYRSKGVLFDFDGVIDLEGVDAVVRTPGMSWQAPLMKEAKERGVPVTSATKLFFDYAPRERVIGVTGTKGKGTTASLIKAMLEMDGRHVLLGGNIGVPMLSMLKEVTPDTWIVLELSSFQLSDLEKSPAIAVVLMVTSEHLDWHQTEEDYVDAKAHLVRCQEMEDAVIVNVDYKNSVRIASQTPAREFAVSRFQQVVRGCCVQGEDIVWIDESEKRTLMEVRDVHLPGAHNLENVCAAVAAAIVAGVSDKAIIEAVRSFTGLEHRLEFVAEKQGIRFYNDSFATTPESTIAAIESFKEPEILILGGSSKNSDFSVLGKTVVQHKNHIRGIVGIGVEWERIKQTIVQAGGMGIEMKEGAQTMEEILKMTLSIGQAGDVILLSPACASFGLFKDYKERGTQFKNGVLAIA